MPRITPLHWRILEGVFRKAGFVFERQGRSHRTYTKKGVARPIVIPTKSEILPEIIRSNTRTAGISHEEYFRLLEECK
jgi:predicted RNA binding protein YcfA (HicA-like mRNA interferase family)